MRLKAKIIFTPCRKPYHNVTFIVDKTKPFTVDIGYDRAWLTPPSGKQKVYASSYKAIDEAVKVAKELAKQEVTIIIDDHTKITSLTDLLKSYGFKVEISIKG